MGKFIHTQNKQTVDKLIELGYTLINESNGNYTFENKSSLTFSLNKQNGLNYISNNILTFN